MDTILDVLPLGKNIRNKNIQEEFTKIFINSGYRPEDVEGAMSLYEHKHYEIMGKFLTDYGMVASKVNTLGVMKDNFLCLPDEIWNARSFLYDVKILNSYIDKHVMETQFNVPENELSYLTTQAETMTSDPIIKGILDKRQAIMVAGPPKLGYKTRTMTGAAVAVSKGLPFLGFETTKQRVLCCLLEDDVFHIVKRFKSFGITKEDTGIVIDNSPMNGILRLRNLLNKGIKENNPYGLVIIDTYLKFTGVENINDYTENTLATAGIKKIAAEYNVGIIVIHHTKKSNEATDGEQILGSQAIFGGLDGYIGLKPYKRNQSWEEEKDIRQMMEFSLRYYESPEPILYEIREGGLFLCGSKKMADLNDNAKELYDFIASRFGNNVFTSKEINAEYNQFIADNKDNPVLYNDLLTPKQLRTLTDKLVDVGMIDKINGIGMRLTGLQN